MRDQQQDVSEFDLISACFAPLSGDGAFCLSDDAACLPRVADGFTQVISTDTIVEHVHFLPDDPPELVAKKALRVNLSDCAAMGARPIAYLLNLSLPPERNIAWVTQFAAGLAADQARYGCTLLGGDTTRTSGPLVISITILGAVAKAQLLTRGGAKSGDEVWVTGAIGAGYLGLRALKNTFDDPDDFFTQRYRCPEPRIGVIPAGIASSCLDISDGLVQDAGHIARQSALSLTIWADQIPLPDRLSEAQRRDLRDACITAGDDFELLFTCGAGNQDRLAAATRQTGVPMTRIGEVTTGAPGVRVTESDGTVVSLPRHGWQHF